MIWEAFLLGSEWSCVPVYNCSIRSIYSIFVVSYLYQSLLSVASLSMVEKLPQKTSSRRVWNNFLKQRIASKIACKMSFTLASYLPQSGADNLPQSCQCKRLQTYCKFLFRRINAKSVLECCKVLGGFTTQWPASVWKNPDPCPIKLLII